MGALGIRIYSNYIAAKAGLRNSYKILCIKVLHLFTLKILKLQLAYRKPPTISPGLIYFRKRFLMGLYKGGLIYGWAYTWTIFCVSNKQVRHKQVGHKQGNKRVLSSDYWTYINWGTYIRGAYIRVGLYSGGLIFGKM